MQSTDESAEQEPVPVNTHPEAICHFDTDGIYRQPLRKENVGVTLCPRVLRGLRRNKVNLSQFIGQAVKAEMRKLQLAPLPLPDEVWGWRDVDGQRQLITFKTACLWSLWDMGMPLPEDRPAELRGPGVIYHDGKPVKVVI